jgi:hypothetical protein
LSRTPGQLHAPAHAGELGQHGEDRVRFFARRDHEARRRHHVHRLKRPDQRQAHADRLAPGLDQHVLAAFIQPPPGDLQLRRTGILGHADDLGAARLHDFGHPLAVGIVEIDHRHAVLGQKLGEEPQLGVEIGLHRAVVVEVILREIGEGRRAGADRLHPPLVQPVGGRLHRHAVDPVGADIGQERLQRQGVGRGVDAGRG